MIAPADSALLRQVEGRGFFKIEGMPQAYLLERQFSDGVLDTSPDAFSKLPSDFSIPQGQP
jgi:hypothetical protein